VHRKSKIVSKNNTKNRSTPIWEEKTLCILSVAAAAMAIGEENGFMGKLCRVEFAWSEKFGSFL
jgi:hypothetical protein